MTVEAGSTDTKTTSAEGAVKRPGGGLLGSTFLRHAALMLADGQVDAPTSPDADDRMQVAVAEAMAGSGRVAAE